MIAFSAELLAAPITNGKIGGVPAGGDLRLWLDASQGVTLVSGAVDSWADQSGNGSDVSAVAATNRPGYNATVINNRASLSFATNDYLKNTTAAGSIFDDMDATLFVVFEGSSAAGVGQVFDTGTGGASRRGIFQNAFGDGSSVSLFREVSPDNVTVDNAAYANGDMLVFTGVYNSTSSRVTLHGASNTNGATNTGNLDSATTASGNPFVLGARFTETSNFFNGKMAEFVVFDSVLNSAQEGIVQNNLSSKYDRALTTGVNRYDGDTSGNGEYDRDVFGVGRVDGSNAQTSGGMSGFGIEETGSSLGTDEWLLAGHKVETNSIVTAEGLSGYTRWDRSWYVDETGDVTALLAFDFSDTGLTYDGSSLERLDRPF